MKTINFTVEDEVYEPFKQAVEENGMRVAGLFRLFMKSFAGGNLVVSGGEVRSQGTEHEKRSPGRPPKEEKKEEKNNYLCPVPPKCEYNGLDVWNSKNLEYVHYMQIPSGIRWPYNGDHELDQTSKWLLWDTKDKEGNNSFSDMVFVYFQEERPKFPDYETWIAEGATKFLNRVARVFVLRNGYRDYNFNIRDVWGEFMAESKDWEKEAVNG